MFSLLHIDYMIAISIFSFLLLLQFFLLKYIIRYIQNIIQKTNNKIDDKIFEAIHYPLRYLFILLSFYLSLNFIHFDEDIRNILDRVLNSLIIVLIFYSFFNLSKVLSFIFKKTSFKGNAHMANSIIMLLEKSLRLFIIILAFVILLQEWGYNIGAFLASIGLGGIAFAMAAKDTISNFFGSLVIISDKTYSIGDWVKIGDIEGVVEDIGIRSTKIRSFANTLFIMPNSSITSNTIENFSKMNKRRIKLNISLIYDTSNESIKAIKKEVISLLREHKDIHQDLILINFNDFGDSGLNLLCYFFTKSTKWDEYLNIREDIHLQIRDIVENHKSDFAYPSQSLYIQGTDINTKGKIKK